MLLIEKLKAPILPSKALHINDSTLSSVKEVGVALNLRCTEARFIILADFLDNCQSDILPFHAPETLEYITTFVPRAKLQASHQLRFTSGLLGLVRANTTPTHHEMISKIIHSSIFDAYSHRTYRDPQSQSSNKSSAAKHVGSHVEYLDDPDAQGVLTEALRTYAATLTPSQFPTLVRRITAILSKINSRSNCEPPTHVPSRRDFFHTLGGEYRVLRPS